MRFLAVVFLALLPVCAQPPGPPQKGGGMAFKNLKVLSPEEVRSAMGQYVQALGLMPSPGCFFCHVQGPDRSLDDNPKKLTARKMIAMVKEINTNLGAEAGKPMVTCYTCHRGKNIPDTAAPPAQ